MDSSRGRPYNYQGAYSHYRNSYSPDYYRPAVYDRSSYISGYYEDPYHPTYYYGSRPSYYTSYRPTYFSGYAPSTYVKHKKKPFL